MDYIELNSNTLFLPDMKAIVSVNTADYLSSDDILQFRIGESLSLT